MTKKPKDDFFKGYEKEKDLLYTDYFADPDKVHADSDPNNVDESAGDRVSLFEQRHQEQYRSVAIDMEKGTKGPLGSASNRPVAASNLTAAAPQVSAEKVVTYAVIGSLILGAFAFAAGGGSIRRLLNGTAVSNSLPTPPSQAVIITQRPNLGLKD